MKQTHILSLLQSGFTTASVSYNLNYKDDAGLNFREDKLYTFKHNLNLQPGDLVVVPGAEAIGGFVLCVVVEAHEEPEIDLDANFEYKWIVSKVEFEAWQDIMNGEKEALK